MGKIADFLDKMPYEKRYNVKPEQVEEVKQWMREREFDGGVSFNADFTQIYKCEILPEKTKK